MDLLEFENLLTRICGELTKQAQQRPFNSSVEFEGRVRDVLQDFGSDLGVSVNYDPHPHVFPDIAVGEFGIEVKFTEKDTWRSVANSVLESRRDQAVEHIYVVFGKMGGSPEVRWAPYEESVIHVRTSHVPRFELEIGAEESLFSKIGVSYEVFSSLSIAEKMKYIRAYARSRLKDGEQLWWLEATDEPEHSLPIEVRVFPALESSEKRRLRAEALLLCPDILRGSRARDKYVDPALYILTYHGVLCYQARDLFSAGSVGHMPASIQDIEHEMHSAALTMDDELFNIYWGTSVKPEDRIAEWLKRADAAAHGNQDFVPSEVLFKWLRFGTGDKN